MSIEAFATPEIFAVASSLGLLAIGMAFTAKQRLAIIERDNHVCQAPFKHNCCGGEQKPVEERKLHVHHILPQRYCETVGIEDPDFAENGVTLCKNSHTGSGGIHPDIATAHSKDDFKRVFEARAEKLKHRQIYWDDSHDRQLHVIAVRNTQNALKGGWVFPVRKR